MSVSRWKERRHAGKLLAAELELEEAEWRIRVWGFADGPKRRYEKEQRVRRAERRLAELRAASSLPASQPKEGHGDG